MSRRTTKQRRSAKRRNAYYRRLRVTWLGAAFEEVYADDFDLPSTLSFYDYLITPETLQ